MVSYGLQNRLVTRPRRYERVTSARVLQLSGKCKAALLIKVNRFPGPCEFRASDTGELLLQSRDW